MNCFKILRILLFKIVIFLLLHHVDAFEPISTLLGGIILGTGAYYKNSIKDLTYCQFAECCNDKYVLDITDTLFDSIKQELFGQHIANDILSKAIIAHTAKVNANISKKPLVISLHGTPGTGKNFVSEILIRSMYKKGKDSAFVHKFLGRSDFPIESNVNEYKIEINRIVREKVKMCPKSLFIFDEVDKMPAGIFESIASLLDHHSMLNGLDFSKAIFIFLSNTGGVEISETLTQLTKNGKWRDDTKLYDFEKILEIGSYNLDGGLKKTSLIESHLVDHFVPFLPLERKHIRLCLEKEYFKWGQFPKESDVSEIIDKFITFDKQTGMYATSGCKTLGAKVAVYVRS
ncbi:TOR1A family protein [Megaselia abdita]